MSLKLTIVMPLTDAAESLPRSLATLAGNLTPECEVLGLCWGCSEETEALFQNTLSAHPHVRMLKMDREDTGGHVFNTGIREAQGEFLTFMDLDDELTPTSVERILGTIADKPTLDVVILTAALGRMDEEMYFVPKFPMRSFPGPCEGSGLRLLEKLGEDGGRLRCEVFLGCYRKAFLLEHDIFVDESLPDRMAHCWTPKVFFYAHHCSTMRKMLPSYWCVQRPPIWETRHRQKFLKALPLSMLALVEFYRDHHREMQLNVRKSWATVTYHSLLLYFFNPKYMQSGLTRDEQRDVLKTLFADPELVPFFERLETYLTFRQRVFVKLLRRYGKGGSAFLTWLWAKFTPRGV